MSDLKDKNGLSLPLKDCETMRIVLERYGITDTGPIDDKNLYVLNDNATAAKIRKVLKSIKHRISSNPEKNFLVIYVLAGHGMIDSGKQVMLLNEFNQAKGFYK